MNYQNELKALLPVYLFHLFLSKDGYNVKLAYFLLNENRKELLLVWYSMLKSTCNHYEIPYIEPSEYLNIMRERRIDLTLCNHAEYLELLINQLKTNEL